MGFQLQKFVVPADQKSESFPRDLDHKNTAFPRKIFSYFDTRHFIFL